MCAQYQLHQWDFFYQPDVCVCVCVCAYRTIAGTYQLAVSQFTENGLISSRLTIRVLANSRTWLTENLD